MCVFWTGETVHRRNKQIPFTTAQMGDLPQNLLSLNHVNCTNQVQQSLFIYRMNLSSFLTCDKIPENVYLSMMEEKQGTF